MRSAMLRLSFVVLLGISTLVRAQDHAAPQPTTTAPHDDAHSAKVDRQPVLPEPSPMPGSVIILILGMFLAAAIVGPVVRYHTPEELPDASAHDAHGHDSHGH